MIIKFKDRKFQEECNTHRLLERRYGKDQAKRIRRRLDDLQAATVLADLRSLPGRCHELKGDRAGQLSLDLVHPDRLIFMPIADFQPDDLTPATSSIDEEPVSEETGPSLSQTALAKQSEHEDIPGAIRKS